MENKITFLDEDGNKIELNLVETVELDDSKYAILAVDGEDDAYVYKIIENEGKEEYITIEDEDEFDRVLEEYNSFFDEE